MGSIIPLSMAGIVLAFLIAVLADFPIGAPTTLFDPNDEAYSVEAVDEVGRLFTGNFNAIIDEMITYQTDPDFARAEARRVELVDHGNRLTGDFSSFKTRLDGEFSLLIDQADALASSTDAMITP
ncbi:MAG: hypothetical protein O2821_11785 [Chloroflexi bacterium]|nr:hypothetical protein [Chloroflexota bacterium]MDA1227446.1 hypothetical protein [Chloroflexota bacterium]